MQVTSLLRCAPQSKGLHPFAFGSRLFRHDSRPMDGALRLTGMLKKRKKVRPSEYIAYLVLRLGNRKNSYNIASALTQKDARSAEQRLTLWGVWGILPRKELYALTTLRCLAIIIDNNICD